MADVTNPFAPLLAGVRPNVRKAIHDPGASEGYRGDRSLTEWQTDAVMRAVLAALSPAAQPSADVAAQARPAWLSNCVICGRIVDTREKAEGGDGHGCEYPKGWVCSSDCAEKLHPDPDWMKEGLAAQAREAALREAAAIARDFEANGVCGIQRSTGGMIVGKILALIGEPR